MTWTNRELALYRQRLAYYVLMGFSAGRAATMAIADVTESREEA